MTMEDKKAIRDFMEKLPPYVRKCMKEVYQRHQPHTVEEFINLSMDCLDENGGGSEYDIEQQKKILGLFKGEFVEVQELLETPEEHEEVTYKPKNKSKNKPKNK